MPDLVLILVALSTAFALFAGLKAVWHNSRLRAGGQEPLGTFRNLVDRQRR
jgi:hypothetical protein